ncbi:MAG: hypothetical protein RRA92_05750 [Gemmatimonadota bacterium]|nr:hypothetical protein [Gemmatimonadota bacterium]
MAEPVFQRRIPEVPWGAVALLALVLAVAGIAGWEAYWRVAQGVVPSYRNGDGQWAEARRRVDRSEPRATVILGSSRLQFDIDLDAWEEETGVRPVQLALEGSNPLPLLTDLADDPDFRGLLVVGVTPPLVLQPGIGYRAEAVGRYRDETPAQRLGTLLSYPLEVRLAFYSIDFALFAVLDRQPWWPARDGLAPAPPEVRKIEIMTRERESDLWDRVETDPAYNRIVTSTWRAILESVPPPPSEEEARRAFEELLAGVRRDVAKIRARGGEVVFVRAPSSDWFREFERQATPRDRVWDPIVAAGGAVGVHFEDHPELADVRTPEWSHISARDKTRWTRSLIAILQDRLAERGITRPELEL